MKRRDFLKSMAALAASHPLLRRLNLASAQSSTQQFFIPPTTLHATENSAVIYFRFSQYTDEAEVVVSQAGQEIRRIAVDASQQLRQVITIDELEPAATYDIEVLAGSTEPSLLGFEEPWGPISVRTQPYEWPIRFAALGDSGFGDSVTAQLAGHIAQQEIDFFIHLGDVVYGSFEYEGNLWLNWMLKYYGPFKETLRRVPHYVTVGNHDREGTTLLDGQSFIYWAFPPINPDEAFEDRRQWTSFMANDVQFLSLNTQTFYSEPGYADQEKWLDERLADTKPRTTIPFFHIPLWTSGSVHAFDGIYASEKWEPKFAGAADRLGVVLAGHSHIYERMFLNDVRYITSGGGSQVIYPMGEAVAWSQKVRSLAHYLLVEVYEDKIMLAAHDVNNDVIDELEWEI